MGAVGGEEAPGMERQPQNKNKANGAILSTKNQADDLPNIDTQYSTPRYTRITLLPARIRERSISPPPPSFFPSQFSDPSSPFRSFQSINVALFSPDNERVKEFRHKGKSERTGRRGIPPGIRTSSPGGYSCNSQNWFSP